jgi:hypothetical protein
MHLISCESKKNLPYYDTMKLIFKFKSEIRITPTAVNEEIKLLQSYSGDDSNRNVLKSIKHISGTIYLVAMTINNNCPIYFFITLKILNLITDVERHLGVKCMVILHI